MLIIGEKKTLFYSCFYTCMQNATTQVVYLACNSAYFAVICYSVHSRRA